jgi:hypothetical protein
MGSLPSWPFLLERTHSPSVEARGVANWERIGIVFHQGDALTLPDIVPSVSTVTQAVEVNATTFADIRQRRVPGNSNGGEQ